MKDEYGVYLLFFGVAAILFIVFLLYLVFRYKKESKRKDEKISSLRLMNAKNEKRYETKLQELQQEIAEHTHTIEKLETQINEGSKNQVVSKIESQQNRRARQLKRAGLQE